MCPTGSGFRVSSSGCGVYGLRVWEFRVQGLEFGVQDLGMQGRCCVAHSFHYNSIGITLNP